MNYEFHVGDYVETWDGAVGYIISVEDDAFTWVNHTPIRDGDDVYFNVEQRNFYSSVKDVFVRIGTYDFTKKEKKIKNLPCVTSTIDYGSNSWPVDKIVEARNKINELVDAVNKLMDKEDNGG